MSKDIRIAVIGTGNWGRRHVRVFGQLAGSRVTHLVDPNPESRALAHSLAPEAALLPDWRALDRDACDAVVIATPADGHFTPARDCLRLDRHVLVEKPLALRTSEATELVTLARERRRRLMVGHILLFHPALQVLHSLMAGNGARLDRIRTQRTDPQPARRYEDALRAFAVHDLAAAIWLAGERPVAVQSSGDLHGDFRFRLRFDRGLELLGQAGWPDRQKRRRLEVALGSEVVRFDDLEPVEKLRLETGAGGTETMDFEPVEPLRRECEHFLECIRLGREPLTGAEHGREVVHASSALEESLGRGGSWVSLGGEQ